jgi:hypothetical protein
MSRCQNLENKYKKPRGRYAHISDLAKRIESMKKNYYINDIALRDHDRAFLQLCQLMYNKIKDQEKLDTTFFQDVADAHGKPERVEEICKHKMLKCAVQQQSSPEWEKNAQHYEDMAVFLRAYGEAEGDQTERVMEFINKILEPSKEK